MSPNLFLIDGEKVRRNGFVCFSNSKVVGIVGLFAAIRFYKKGFVNVQAALYMSLLFAISAGISAKYSVHLNENILRKIFALFTVSIGVYYFFKKEESV